MKAGPKKGRSLAGQRFLVPPVRTAVAAASTSASIGLACPPAVSGRAALCRRALALRTRSKAIEKRDGRIIRTDSASHRQRVAPQCRTEFVSWHILPRLARPVDLVEGRALDQRRGGGAS